MPVTVEGQEIATVGSPTEHGTPLGPGPGAPTVRVNGKPVWRVAIDFHACPQFDGPKPHVGGKVTPATTTTVKTWVCGGLAAQKTNQIVEASKPNTILQGAKPYHSAGASKLGGILSEIPGIPDVINEIAPDILEQLDSLLGNDLSKLVDAVAGELSSWLKQLQDLLPGVGSSKTLDLLKLAWEDRDLLRELYALKDKDARELLAWLAASGINGHLSEMLKNLKELGNATLDASDEIGNAVYGGLKEGYDATTDFLNKLFTSPETDAKPGVNQFRGDYILDDHGRPFGANPFLMSADGSGNDDASLVLVDGKVVKKSEVDWEFMQKQETSPDQPLNEGFVPTQPVFKKDKNGNIVYEVIIGDDGKKHKKAVVLGHQVIGKSGITVGDGNDINARNPDALDLSPELKKKLNEARDNVDISRDKILTEEEKDALNAKAKKYVDLSSEELAELNAANRKETENEARKFFEKGSNGVKFDDLPSEAKTVIVDLAHQNDKGVLKDPAFKDMQNGDWEAASKKLSDKKKFASRNDKRADKLDEAIDNGSLPKKTKLETPKIISAKRVPHQENI